MIRHSIRTGLAVALAIAPLGCGNLTAGGVGEARVTVSGDAPDVVPQAAAVVNPRPPAATAGGVQPMAIQGRVEGEESPEGEIEADFRLYLVAGGGAEVALSDDKIEVRMDLEGFETPEVANRTVPADVYTGMRMVFTKIKVEVDRGLIINGVPVTGEVRIEVEAEGLSVTKPLALTIEDDAMVDLLVDLNAASWLQAVDPATVSVDPQVFADLITVVVR
jgi:hypothetical protein